MEENNYYTNKNREEDLYYLNFNKKIREQNTSLNSEKKIKKNKNENLVKLILEKKSDELTLNF